MSIQVAPTATCHIAALEIIIATRQQYKFSVSYTAEEAGATGTHFRPAELRRATADIAFSTLTMAQRMTSISSSFLDVSAISGRRHDFRPPCGAHAKNARTTIALPLLITRPPAHGRGACNMYNRHAHQQASGAQRRRAESIARVAALADSYRGRP